MMWFNYVLMFIAIQETTGDQTMKFVHPWPIDPGKPLVVNCSLQNIGGLDDLKGHDGTIDKTQNFIRSVKLSVGNGTTFANYSHPFSFSGPPTVQYGTFLKGFNKSNFHSGGGEKVEYNAFEIFLAMKIEKAECYHFTNYTCFFEFLTKTNLKKENVYSDTSFSMETEEIKYSVNGKTTVRPSPVVINGPMDVTCSHSEYNDDVKISKIHLFIKHGESFKRLFTYSTDESATPATMENEGFQLAGVTTESFNKGVNMTDGKPRHFLMMKIDRALREHITIYKCQFEVPTSCQQTEEFISAEVNAVECSDLCGVHKCETRDFTTTCICPQGFENSGPLRCRDIDECVKYTDICQKHKCINTNGSYICKCLHGYHNISLQTCVEYGPHTLALARERERSIFDYQTIAVVPVMIGFSAIIVAFLIYTATMCGKTVSQSIYRYSTTKPAKGHRIEAVTNHYMLVTRFVETLQKGFVATEEKEEEDSEEMTSISIELTESVIPGTASPSGTIKTVSEAPTSSSTWESFTGWL